MATIINIYDSTQFEAAIPFAQELPMGKYLIKLNTIPEIRRTVYVKPAQIVRLPIHKPVPFHMRFDRTVFEDYKLYYARYPYKSFIPCVQGPFKETSFPIYLQPKRLYQVTYRKKGRRRYKKKQFYIDSSMEEFILTLD